MSQRNGRIEEVPEFHLRHCCKTKIGRGSGHYSGTVGKIQELQNEINCTNDSRAFQDAESVRSGHSHVASQPVSFPPHPVPGGMLNRSFRMPSRTEGPPSIWDTHGISGNVFVDPAASSSAPYPQELNPWSSGRAEPIHSSTAADTSSRPEMPVRTVSQKFSHP